MRSMLLDPKDHDSLNHQQANLLEGMDRQHWPNSRYVVFSLSFDIQGQDQPTPWIEGLCGVYDPKTGPDSFADYNAKTIKTPGSDRK